MASKICKIVYFDEDSVTDYVQIVAGGTLEKTTELLNSSDLSEEQKADVSAKGGIGGVFKALLGWEASASGEVSAGLALNRNKMVKNIVKNTILTNYSVELGQAIFLLTCNFSNENEIKKALGPAMFSRIGCCVEYADLTVEQKQKIVNNWYDSIMASLKDDERVYIETTDIHEWFLKNAERYDNIRILKSKMENAIFEKLTDHFIIMTGSMAEGTQDRV